MLPRSLGIGQILVKRITTSAATNMHPDPMTMAGLTFLADMTKSNAENHRILNDRLDDHRKENDGKHEATLKLSNDNRNRMDDTLKQALDKFASSVEGLRSDFHSLDKKVTYIVASAASVVSLISIGATFGLWSGFKVPEAVSSLL